MASAAQSLLTLLGKDFSLKLISQFLTSRIEKSCRPDSQQKRTAASLPTLLERQLHRKKKEFLNCGGTKENKMKYYWITVIAIEWTQLRYFQNELGAKPQRKAVTTFLDSTYAVLGKEFGFSLCSKAQSWTYSLFALKANKPTQVRGVYLETRGFFRSGQNACC